MIDVSSKFHAAAFGQIIKPLLKLAISFDKKITGGSFFTLDQSQLSGPDILKFAASDADTQSWDFYDYKDFTDRLVSCSWERSIAFPYQVQAGMADFVLSNTDGYFTPLNSKSPIGDNNLPSRPLRISAGFSSINFQEIIPQFAGITEGLPEVVSSSKTASYHAIDFLYDICNKMLTTAINMRNARTDEVIGEILQSAGLSPTQYRLAKGKFTVPFVFFDEGSSIGDALKQLVQSENGFMWLDEKGIVRFETSAGLAADTDVVANLSDYDIVSLDSGEFTDLVNHVRISAELREVQEYQEVYAKTSSQETVSDSLWIVPANSTFTITCSLTDPCYDIVTPTLGRASSVSWFTAFDEHLQPVTNGITASGVISSNAYTITFTNTHAYAVEIDEMKLWGEPAKVYDVLDYDAYDQESIDKFGDKLLEISTNQFFQTYQQASMFARTLITQYKDVTRMLKVKIKGDFSFQLLDMIKLETADHEHDGLYHIMGSSCSLEAGKMETTLTLNGTSIEDGVFTLNISALNGEDLLQ